MVGHWSEPIRNMTVERCVECAGAMRGSIRTRAILGRWFGFYRGPDGIAQCADPHGGSSTERDAARCALWSLARDRKLLAYSARSPVDRVKLDEPA